MANSMASQFMLKDKNYIYEIIFESGYEEIPGIDEELLTGGNMVLGVYDNSQNLDVGPLSRITIKGQDGTYLREFYQSLLVSSGLVCLVKTWVKWKFSKKGN